MAVNIAVASSDGIWIDQHFGRALRFIVYRCDADGFAELETRESTAPCNGRSHDDDRLTQAIERIADCRAVLVQAIGPGALDQLLARRIHPVTSGGAVEEALWSLIHSKRFTYLNQGEH